MYKIYPSINHNADFVFGTHDFFPLASDMGLIRLFSNETYAAHCAMNLDENENEYVLTVELPGFKQSHLDLVVENDAHTGRDILTIRAKKNETQYERTVTIPHGVDSERVDAKLEDGILTVKLPKSPEVKPRRIEIK